MYSAIKIDFMIEKDSEHYLQRAILSKCAKLWLFSPHLGYCKITLSGQVSELWFCRNKSRSQLTRLSMTGLKVLAGIHH